MSAAWWAESHATWTATAAEIHQRFGIRVVVRHDWTPHDWTLRHHGWDENGANHIVIDSPGRPLRSGRLVRNHNQALCQTPSRDHDLRALESVEHPDALQEDRIPTCRACLRVAARLVGQTAA